MDRPHPTAGDSPLGDSHRPPVSPPASSADSPARQLGQAATLRDPDRTLAALSVRREISDLLDQFNDDLEGWMDFDREPNKTLTLGDARDKLQAAIQRVDVLQTLGRPSREAFEQAHRQIAEQ